MESQGCALEERASSAGVVVWDVRPWVVSLDALRGVAALAVVVHHSALAWGGATDGASIFSTVMSWLGVWGVTLFFVLSGFCIHLPQARRLALDPDHAVDWTRFAKRRAWRLLPTHYAALILSAVTGYFLAGGLIGAPTAGNFIAHVFMVHVWYAPFFHSINMVFWSIAVEVHFYLSYPAYLWLRRKLGAAGTVGLLLAVGAVIYLAATAFVDEPGPRFVLQKLFLVTWWQWALGASLADLYVRGQAGRWAKLLAFPFAPAVYLLLSVAIGVANPSLFGLHLRYWGVAFLFGAMVASCVIRRGHRIPFLSCAGTYSYSIYLVHPVAFAWLFAIPGYSRLPAAVGGVATVVLPVFVSWGFFLLVERHFLSVRRDKPCAV